MGYWCSLIHTENNIYYHYLIFGYSSIVIPVILSVLGFALFTNRRIKNFYRLFLCMFLVAIWISTFIAYLSYDNLAGLVGNALKIFLGDISLRSSSLSCMRRQRLRRAMATARLASCWPTMCLSSSWTISRGVICDMVAPVARIGERVRCSDQ